ncbi:carboxypeptidase-like regulatory domain-containing protein [Hymenobacter sp. UYCo722]|uniref:carboxypeptidase-like regulatory domain-containing protein n=1 Tax=Hymenobacter sp. UYCo722 TaxID=3156335 RepID=UPI0033988012
MHPTANGRLCGQCDKEIYDFSGMAWPAIARTQAEHGNALCGMYTPAQLKHWGQMPPPSTCAKLAATTTLALALSAIPAASQTPGGRTISGTVMYFSDKGKPKPVPGATVLVAGTQIGVSTDSEGRYELALPDDKTLPKAARIQFMSMGLTTAEWPLPLQNDGPLHHDALLQINPNSSLSVFSVGQPTLPERAKWTLKRWFGRRK